MAEVESYRVSAQIWDSAGKKGSFSSRIGATDAKAFVAAADTAARATTKVWLLAKAALQMSADGIDANHWITVEVSQQINNTLAEQAPQADHFYRTNKWRVECQTTNGGLPASDVLYIPVRGTHVAMELDGITAANTDAFVIDLIAQVIDTALSKYNTPITAVTSVTVNDE